MPSPPATLPHAGRVGQTRRRIRDQIQADAPSPQPGLW